MGECQGWGQGRKEPGCPQRGDSPVSPCRCLLDGQLGRSRFLPRRGDGSLRFQLDTFLFLNASGSQVCARGLGVRGDPPHLPMW